MQIAPSTSNATPAAAAHEIDIAPSPYQRHLLGKRMPDQQRVLEACLQVGMNGDGDDPAGLIKLAKRIANCCRGSAAAVTSSGTLRVVEFRCKSKLCPICSKRRAAAVFAKVGTAIRKMDSARFITLSLASSDTPLRDQLLRLRKCFAELRRRVDWKAKVKGGVYTLEITRNRKTGLWHPHLHLIVDGDFIHQSNLSEMWHQVTGDSYIVDIRKVYSAKNAAQYIAKYVSKSLETADLDDDALVEWIEQVRSIRFVQSFGNLHGVKLDDRDEENDSYVEPERLGSMEDLAHDARRNDQEARELFAYLTAIRHRRVPHGGSANAGEAPAGEREIIDRLRTWFRNKEIARRDYFARCYAEQEERLARDGKLW